MDLDMNSFEQDNCSPCKDNADGPNWWIFILRKVIISISATALIVTLVFICKRNQLRLPSIKLLTLLFVFYFISLVSVLPHTSSMNLNQHSINNTACQMQKYLSCLKQDKEVLELNQAEGVINLTSYSMAYWFGVCLLMYIRHQLENKRPEFNKQMRIGTICAFVSTLIWYLIPVLFDFGIAYSPTGYGMNDDDNSYLFYAGLVSEPQKKYLVAIWMLAIPIIYPILTIPMHLKIIQISKRILRQQQNMSRKQFFLIRLNKFSYLLWAVQIINAFKFFIAIQNASYAVFILNIVFDLLAFGPIFIYFTHYSPKDPIYQLQESSSILNSEDGNTGESLVD